MSPKIFISNKDMNPTATAAKKKDGKKDRERRRKERKKKRKKSITTTTLGQPSISREKYVISLSEGRNDRP